MPNLNKVFLIGNLTRDPELKYIPSGAPVCDFGLAVNETYTDKDGEKHEMVCFIDITTWNKTAENCANYLEKGRAVFVEGRLKFDSWEKEGQKHSKLSVVADRVQFLGGKKKAGDGADDDIPF